MSKASSVTRLTSVARRAAGIDATAAAAWGCASTVQRLGAFKAPDKASSSCETDTEVTSYSELVLHGLATA